MINRILNLIFILRCSVRVGQNKKRDNDNYNSSKVVLTHLCEFAQVHKETKNKTQIYIMKIQFNTDKTISGDERQEDYFTTQISNALERFDPHVSRIEVHLKDENGQKDGFNDISCLLEARIEGKQPIAVSNQADSVKDAVSGAIDKMSSALNSIVGRMQTK